MQPKVSTTLERETSTGGREIKAALIRTKGLRRHRCER
jgi:hypothetical protein